MYLPNTTCGRAIAPAAREDLPLRRGQPVADLPRGHGQAGRDEAHGGVEEGDGAGHAEEGVPHHLAICVGSALETKDSRVVRLEVERVKVLLDV